MNKPLRVLIIEDNEDDAILEIDELISGGFDIVYERIETREAMREALRDKTWDCIISDYAMPQFSGLDALTEMVKSKLDIPFILISGIIGEETAVAAMKAGAHDYIMKNNLKRLVPAFKRELHEAEVRNQKRQAENAIQFERILLRTLIDNLPDLIYIKDTKCRVITANKANTEYMGYSSETEIIGKTDLDIFNNENGIAGYEEDMNIIRNGLSVVNREKVIIDAKGNPRWMLTTKIPIYNKQGQISGLVGLDHDITDRKQMELELKNNEQDLLKQNLEFQALNNEYLSVNEELTESINRIQKMNEELIISKNKAEESDRLKSAFLANMSHEIRTPLNAIMGFSGFLRNTHETEEKTKEYVDIIESSGKQLLSIINDIIEISIIEADQIKIVPGTVNITKLAGELFQLFKKQADIKNLNLILYPDNLSEDIIAQTDGFRLKQILCNLLNNAIKFTSGGKIEFSYTLQDEFLLFSVMDTGIGIEPDMQSIIYEPFRQVESGSARNYGGNGLGLSISKALVDKLGGTLTHKSELRKGSNFTFTIPYIKSIEKENSRNPIPDNDLDYRWDQYTILVAEDEMFNYCYIEELLSSTNVQMLHAWDGKEAVELVKHHPDISLVLMDIKMPEMDGYVATRMIKEIRPRLPVIAQTAFALSKDRENALQAGFDYYISKPVSHNFFKKVISNYLS